MTNTNFIFDEEKHTYKLDGQYLPSVTTIINTFFPISDFIPKELLKKAADLGKKIHSATELYDKGTLDLKTLHPTLKKYLDQWIRFKKDFDFICTGIELSYFHPTYKFAGRLDREGFIKGNKSVIIDIKSGIKINTHELQSAAYKILQNANNTNKAKFRYAVYLSETDYKVVPHLNKTDENIFLSALNLYNYKRKKS